MVHTKGHNMKRRSLLKGAAAALCAVSLAACSSGGGGSDTGGSVAPGDGEGKTLTLWIMEGTNASSDSYITKLTEKFKEKTGADLNVQLQPWAGAHDKFVTSIAGGTAPDVAEVGTTWTPEFADLGALADLTERVKGENLDLVEGLVTAGTLDDKLYGMPWYAGIRSFLYNKELFEQAGIDKAPTSWAELDDAIAKLKELDGVIPFPIAGGSQYGFIPFIWGAGGELATESDGTFTSALDSPEAIEGIKYYTDLALEKGASTPAAATWKETDSLAQFQDGKIGMIISGSWVPATIKQESPDFLEKVGAFPIPAKDGGIAKSFVGGSHLAMFEDSENKDLAWELIKLMSTGELAQQWAEESNFFPGDAKLLDEYLGSDDELVKVFATQMKDGGGSVPVTPHWGAVEGEQIIPTLLQSVLTGKASAEDAAKTAAEAMNSTLQRK